MSKSCVCICTHDRPESLEKLLVALAPQLQQQGATLVVIDNGKKAAEQIVQAAANGLDFNYVRLDQPGLVAARNNAFAAALKRSPQMIAFIDDDEFPDPQWLANLIACLEETGCDICFGPVRPAYAVPPQPWALQGPFFWKNGRAYGTCNTMLRASILPSNPSLWFQPAFAFLGGEDEEFFARLEAGGAKVTTAAEAWVSEIVPASRMTLGYVMSTGVRDGAIEIALMKQRGCSTVAIWVGAARHIAAKLGYMLYHLALFWKGSWHAVAALRDAAEIVGTIKALAGSTGDYYGSRS